MHYLSVSSCCRFVRNMSPSTGGGLHTTFLVEGAESEFHRIFVYGTIFNRNQAQYGGGGFFLPLGKYWSRICNGSSTNSSRSINSISSSTVVVVEVVK